MANKLTPYELVQHQLIGNAIKHHSEIKSIANTCLLNSGDKIDILWLCSMIFQYGIIIGKRQERQKRKAIRGERRNE